MRAVLASLIALVGVADGAPRPAADVRAEEAARADAWAMADRCAEAIPHYEKALGGGGTTEAKLRARLAQCLVARTPDAAAVARADKVVADGLTLARDPELLLVAAELAARRGDSAKAIALDTEAEKGPTRRAARLARLGVLAKLGASDEEYRRVAIALARSIARDAFEPTESRDHATSLLANLRFGADAPAMLSVRTKLAEGDLEGALVVLEPLLTRTPVLEDAWYLAGLARQGLGRRKDALVALRRAPGIKEAQIALGIAEFEDGNLDEAKAAFELALAQDERCQPALYYAGLVARERGDTKTARATFARAIAAGPETAMGHQASTKLQLLTGQIHALAEGQVIDAAQEVAIGQAIAEKVTARFGSSSDEALRVRLDRILHRLAAVADRPEREIRYRVQIVESPIPNALTLPGGTILVFRGIADLVKKDLGDSDDAWASILGHECAHAALRHGVGMMRMSSSLTTGNAFDAGPIELAQLMNTISRAHEFEADQFGALYAYRAGFQPAESLRLHEAMLRRMGEIPHGLTHPTHAERLEGLRDYLVELRGKVHGFDLALKSLDDNELDAAIVRFEVFLGVFPDSLSARSNLGVALQRKASSGLAPTAELRRVTDVDVVSGARKVELHSTGAATPRLDRSLLAAAVAEYRSALAIDPSYAPAFVNLGAALFDLGDKAGARLALDRAIARAPRSPESWINHASVVEAEGKPLDAQADLRRAIALDDKGKVAWFDLALVSERLGRGAEAKTAWDRYLALDGASAWADVAKQRRAAIK
ncbi:MAG: M48 family metalloprotease [Polyangia bacterium]